ncbi:MAG: hypothetical protein CMC08_07500 [Flavobacteriaceae bacterium]|nr:hypothetical protein [Flavobacteriaceae bacterium]
MKNTLLCLVSVLLFIACKDQTANTALEGTRAQADTLSTAQLIAQNHGIANWDAVTELAFTFNVDRDTNHFERSWIWLPKQNRVTQITDKDTVTYTRSKVDSTLSRTDAAFINDSYWLLAPFKLVWDEGTEFSEEMAVVAPISKDTLNRLTISYVGDGGYTPGDAYDFFYDDTHTIREWVFRKGNDSIPSMVTTWEDYQEKDGLKLSTVHTDSLGKFKLYFTGISVKN